MLQNGALKLGALHSWLRPHPEPLALGRDLTIEVALIQQGRRRPGLAGETDHRSAIKKTQK